MAEPSGGQSRRSSLFRLLKTTSFRFTLSTVAVFMIAVAALGIFVYQATIGSALQQTYAEVEQEADDLYTIYTLTGYRGLRGNINLRTQPGPFNRPVRSDQNQWLYLLVNGRTGKRENVYSLQYVPDTFLGEPNAPPEIKEFSYELEIYDPEDTSIVKEKQSRTAIGTLRRVWNPENGELDGVYFVGRDVTNLVELRAAARGVIYRVALATLVLGLLIGYLSSRAFLARIDNVNRTANAIRGGDLSRRIALTEGDDEFDSLAKNLNGMLDQIERLMLGMRQVSDNIAHDLRSPLTRIRNRIDAALSQPDEDARETLVQTSEDVDRLLGTFNALLSITRIESGERLRNQSTFDLTSIVEEVIDLYEPAAQEAGFDLTLVTQPTPPIRGVPELVSQALVNLLDNAIKYAVPENPDTERPRIEVKVAPRVGGGALLSVSDNGRGVPAADRERIVNRFVRLETSRSTPGSGLGLSMVAAIARAHNGQLSIGPGLARHPGQRGLAQTEDYGLGIRIAFPPPKDPEGSRKPDRQGQPDRFTANAIPENTPIPVKT